ncbi:aldehyde dehydrogenase family protein, partial [Hafnia paralvei]
MAYETRNPYTGELLEAYPDATDTEVNQAIENAHAAFLLWKETEFAERACVMHSAATILRRDVDFFAKLLTVEMGKLVSEAKAEIALSA